MLISSPRRFSLLPLCKAVSILFAACSLLAFLTAPSTAGTWVITYSNSGKTS